MEHLMTPTGVAVALIFALTLDALSIGPNSIRDRIAFVIAVGAIYEGFNGSPLDQWTIGALGGLVDQLKAMTGGAYIAGAATEAILSMGVLAVAVITIGVLLPVKAQEKLGPWAAMSFGSGGQRINFKLWGAAAILAMFCDLPGGVLGDLLRQGVMLCDRFAAFVPNLLLGVQ